MLYFNLQTRENPVAVLSYRIVAGWFLPMAQYIFNTTTGLWLACCQLCENLSRNGTGLFHDCIIGVV